MTASGDDTGSKCPAEAHTGLVYDEAYLDHDTGPGHPETPARLKAMMDHLEEEGILPRLRRIEPRSAAEKWIKTIHSTEYVREVEDACSRGNTCLHSLDTRVCSRSFDVALLAAGGVMAAVDAVMGGEITNAFCAVRPPGHHATADRAMGFCLFNNVAIATRYAQREHGIDRVLIVDWDTHHGNGTQDAFYDDDSVLYFSTHQSPFYPGTGAESETGEGQGEGYTLNVPLPAGTGDGEYLEIFEQRLQPRALEFRPELVFISAGFDTHREDTIGGMQVTEEGYARMTQHVMDMARQCCGGKLISVLEGGYGLEAQARSAAAHLRALMAGANG